MDRSLLIRLSLLTALFFIQSCSLFQKTNTVTVEGQTDPITYRYIQRLSNKVEIIGASRYPDMSKHITEKTSIDIELILSRYGKLLSSRILRASNNTTLNEQMFDIINYSAPYPPLPEELDLDKLIIQKRWYFSPAH